MHYLFHASKKKNPPYGQIRPKNHRGGTCDYCGQPVPDNQGVLLQDKGAKKFWQLYHFACLELEHPEVSNQIKSALATKHVVKISLDTDPKRALVVAPNSYGPPNTKDAFFNVFLPAFRANGGKGVKDTRSSSGWKNVVEFADIPKLTKALEESGVYTVSVSADIAQHTKGIASALDSAREHAKKRTKEVEAEIKKWNEAHRSEIANKELHERLWLPHQPQGIEWLMTRPLKGPNSTCGNALLADDPGLGKTMQAILALPEGAPCIVVCPVSVKYNWQDEFKMWRPDRPVPIVIDGTAKAADAEFTEPKWRWPGRNETIIIGNAGLSKEPSIPKARGTVLIVDEAQDFKGDPKNTQRAKRIRLLADQIQKTDGCVWLLTGTPLENIAANTYNILDIADLVEPAFGGRSGFIRAWGVPLKDTPVGQVYDWRSAKPDTKAVTAGLDKVMLRRQQALLREAGILPQKYRVTLPPIELDAKALKAMAGFVATEEELARIVEERSDRGDDEDEIVGKLDKGDLETLMDADEGDNTIGSISAARRLLSIAKIPAAEAFVAEFEKRKEPILVFSAYSPAVVHFGKRPGWAKIDGSVKAKERRQIVKDFQKGKLKGVAIVIRAGGTGLTLHRANTALFIDLEWNPAKNIQAEDRAYRIGQKRDVTIYQMVSNHLIDLSLYKLLRWKQDQMDATVNAVTGQTGPILAPIIVDEVLPDLSGEKTFRPEDYASGPQDPKQARKEWLDRLEETRKDKMRGKLEPTRQQVEDPTRRPPQNEHEVFLMEAAGILSRLDDDFAREQNGIGWNKPDTVYGHQLAALAYSGGLADYQWRDLGDMIPKYHRQVGRVGEAPKKAKVIVRAEPKKPKSDKIPSPPIASSSECPGFSTKAGRPPKDESTRKCGNCGRMRREHPDQQLPSSYQ